MKISPGKAVFTAFALLACLNQTYGEAERGENIKLPSGIATHHEDGKFTYVISGIIKHTPELELKESQKAHQILVPDCEHLSLNRAARKCSFTTTRELPWEELAATIDEMARKGGEIPYWSELEARDLPTSEKTDLVYKISRHSAEPPEGAEWITIPKAEGFDTEISLPANIKGRILIVPSTAMCMCHSRYSFRILDQEGKVVWRDDREAYGSIQVAVTDIDRDGTEEILLERDDHGKGGRFLIQLKQEKR
ncbi:hypothetical protein [Luteolibacter luteus]|uniref:Uncharacterized protein n=1 Tax=Luteolibacter luteus TaxID=2728835 RepID=A0A858RDY0_9BACT|nr:hypothetical protein [Luteolibacter luteus]QJE95007.1 hypothetical protein HHL09_04210 [Luteolibacter luteus]